MVTKALAPYRKALERRLKKLSTSVRKAPDKATEVAVQAELASIGRGLALASTLEGLEHIPPQNRAFTLGKLHEATEELGGSDAAITELVTSYVLEVKQ